MFSITTVVGPFTQLVNRAGLTDGYLLLSAGAALIFYRLKEDELGPTLAALIAFVTVLGRLFDDTALSCCENLYGYRTPPLLLRATFSC